MRIRWTNHPTNPRLNGIETDVAREFAIVAEGYGQCERVKPARRGTKEWFAQRMEQSTMPRQVHAADDSVAPPVLTPGWAVVTRDGPGGQRYFVQEVRASGETFLYDGPPSSAPATIVARYQELSGGNVDPAIAAEAARVAKCERDNAALANTELETKAYHRIFGGR